MHALVYRGWKNRVKGRDWYDFEWYVRHNVPLDFAHLAERVRQFNNEEIGQAEFMAQLKDRLASANINQVKSQGSRHLVKRLFCPVGGYGEV